MTRSGIRSIVRHWTTKRIGFFLVALVLLLLYVPNPASTQTVDPAALSSLRFRSLGPPGAGGRITAVEVDPSDGSRVFVGAAGGGVWRSENGGTTWTPVFDRAPVQTIGAVAISPADPDVVWVGTGGGDHGEGSQAGQGVFRSRDGGESWQPVGLEATERIRRIVAHPADPEVAWVATMGPAWTDGPQRGVFRTTDGGRSWQPVLQVDEETGAADLIRDPENPERLYAAFRWARAGASSSGEVGRGGLYITDDGGRTWELLGPEQGVPAGARGIALARSSSDPRIVYALAEVDGEVRLLRSDDRGRSWSTGARWSTGESGAGDVDLRVDGDDPDRVYRLGASLALSRDGGASFELLDSPLPGPVRALWVDPSDPRHLVAGTARGVFASRDRGGSWRFVEGVPVSAVRRVSVDLAVPFRIYVALEGEGSWVGPSDTGWRGGRPAAGWSRIDPGDGTTVLADPRDSRFVYSVTGSGDVRRVDRRTGERKGIAPWAPREAELRFGETTPLAFDPFRPELIYLGSQYVHRTPERGTTWQIISGDLSGGGTPGSISSIAPSPVEEEVLWVGTDDGRLHLTRSSGGTWTERTDRLPGGGTDGARVTDVEASRHRGGTAFVALDRRRSGDREPQLYRTEDYGGSWEALDGEGGLQGVVKVIEQDPVAPELLFAGTTRGLYTSLDGGGRWIPLSSGLPNVSIQSLLVHPRDYDLVVGTAGRGVYVLDDVRPLRELARRPELLDRPLHLFDPPPAYRHHPAEPQQPSATGDHGFRGEGRPYGALLTYRVGAGAAGDSLRLEVVDDRERVVGRARVPGAPGVRRVAWDLGVDPPGAAAAVDAGGEGPPLLQALPGRYTVRLRSSGGEIEEATLRVLPDPRSELSEEERRTGHEAILRAYRLLGVPHQAVERLDRVEAAVDRVLERVSGRSGSEADTLRERGRRLRERARELNETARTAVRDDRVLESLSGSFGPPAEAQRIALQELEDEMEELAGRVNDFLLGRISLYNDRLRAAGFEGLPDFEEIGR